VHTSYVKSLTLDHWNRRDILCMLEGGNDQLYAFFDRHGLMGNNSSIANNGTASNNGIAVELSSTTTNTTNARVITVATTGAAAAAVPNRYTTKAASFYRQHLKGHAGRIARGGRYEGREASRRTSSNSSSSSNKNGSNVSSSVSSGMGGDATPTPPPLLSDSKICAVEEEEGKDIYDKSDKSIED